LASPSGIDAIYDDVGSRFGMKARQHGRGGGRGGGFPRGRRRRRQRNEIRPIAMLDRIERIEHREVNQSGFALVQWYRRRR
jgi:hypothetical protein